jgi:hypothetical protein
MTDKKNPVNETVEKNLSIVKPIQNLAQFTTDQDLLHEFIKSKLVSDVDFGIIPGTNKRSLWQPGAEKIGRFYGIGAKFTLIKEVEDWDKGFFYYRYQCQLIHRTTGQFIGEIERSCNSQEKKYSQYSVSEKYATAEQKGRSIGRSVNQRGYSMLKVMKSAIEMADVVNTVQSMAQKRAFVACVRLATAASDYFVSDISESNGTQPTMQSDPVKKNQMAKLHAVAAPRGFDDEKLHKCIVVMFGKQSRTELTGKEIDELTEELLSKFQVVGDGNEPVRINTQNVPLTVTPPEPEIVSQEEIKTQAIDPIVEEPEKVEPEKPVMCYQCKTKPVKKGTWFCSKECQNKYYPPKKEDTLMDKIKKRNEAVASWHKKLTETKLKSGITVWVDMESKEKCECGAEIYWATTDKNKKPMPVEKIIDPILGEEVWETHFASCPLAEEKRKK